LWEGRGNYTSEKIPKEAFWMMKKASWRRSWREIGILDPAQPYNRFCTGLNRQEHNEDQGKDRSTIKEFDFFLIPIKL